jgi:hypothetical protein
MASQTTTSDAVPKMPSAAVRRVVSAVVLFHVVAVFLGPFATPPQTSQLAMNWGRAIQPYLDVLNLANGYRFFAPEPGPSHLVRYELTMPDGTTRDGIFPNRQEHWPRLLYHRYFMLSEFLNTLSNPAMPKEHAEAYARGYAEELAAENGAKSVKLFLRRHYVPRMEEVRAGMRLDDKRLDTEQLVGVFERDAS